MATRSTSEAAIALITAFEGVVLHAYNDAVGHCTVGVGRLLHLGGCTHAEFARYKNLTRAEAEKMLLDDLKDYEKPINTLGLPLNQNQFDALVSFTYNVGTGGVASSTRVGRELRAHNWQAAADALLAWDKAGGRALAGLTRRRQAERALFLRAVGKPDSLDGYTSSEKRWIHEYDHLARTSAQASAARLATLQAVMRQQRKRVWHAAQIGGWDDAHRRERYASLLARTR